MIRPLRRYHRRLIAAIVVTLTIAALFAITHPAPDVRMEALPASLLPAGDYGPTGDDGPAPEGRAALARGAAPEKGAAR